ncbi:MAG: hypothetical protein WD276_07360 [Actinomycetota bacterium]
MTRLRKLEPVGFRGIRLPSALDFTRTCKSMVIFGANGHGKSSYVDALECYFHGRIRHLEKENVSKAAYRHRDYPKEEDAGVRIEFDEAACNGALLVDGEKRVSFAPETEGGALLRTEVAQELVILRHRDLSRFVDMTKGEKLADLAPLIGVQELDQARDELSSATRRLEDDLTENTRLIAERRKSAEITLGLKGFDEAAVWKAVNERFKLLDIDASVGDPATLGEQLARTKVVSDPARDQKVKRLQLAQSAVDSLASGLDLAPLVNSFGRSFEQLNKDAESLRLLSIADLLQAGLNILNSSSWEEDSCPLCRQPVQTGVLRDQVETGIHTAAEVRKRRDNMVGARDRAERAVDNAKRLAADAIDRLSPVSGDAEETKVVRDIQTLLVNLSQFLEVNLPTVQFSSQALEDWNSTSPGLLAALADKSKSLGAAAASVAPSKEETDRLSAFRTLSSVESELVRLAKLAGVRIVIERDVKSLRNVVRSFEAYERECISRILSQLSGHVSTFYQQLHGGERYSNVRLEWVDGGRGLEFSLEAYGQKVTPPRLLLSESHLSSLGLCLFLAAAREFNSRSQFIVLDDVVNSFDADHRASLARLLTEEFEDVQLLVLTHDPIWYDILRRMAPDWLQLRLGHWTYDLGVQVDSGPEETRRRIASLLDSGDTITAGNMCRSHTENRLKWLCEKLGTPVPFRMGYENERRTPEELFLALERQVSNRSHFAGRGDVIWSRFRASPFIANLASHDQPEVPVPLTVGDIRLAMNLVTELEQVFRCRDCTKWVWFADTDTSRHECQCRCGKLEFR